MGSGASRNHNNSLPHVEGSSVAVQNKIFVIGVENNPSILTIITHCIKKLEIELIKYDDIQHYEIQDAHQELHILILPPDLNQAHQVIKNARKKLSKLQIPFVVITPDSSIDTTDVEVYRVLNAQQVISDPDEMKGIIQGAMNRNIRKDSHALGQTSDKLENVWRNIEVCADGIIDISTLSLKDNNIDENHLNLMKELVKTCLDGEKAQQLCKAGIVSLTNELLINLHLDKEKEIYQELILLFYIHIASHSGSLRAWLINQNTLIAVNDMMKSSQLSSQIARHICILCQYLAFNDRVWREGPIELFIVQLEQNIKMKNYSLVLEVCYLCLIIFEQSGISEVCKQQVAGHLMSHQFYDIPNNQLPGPIQYNIDRLRPKIAEFIGLSHS